MSLDKEEHQIARIRVLAKLEFLPATLSAIRDILSKLGMKGADVNRFEVAIEESCLHVINHSFDPGEEGIYYVLILRRPGKIVVAVEDQGLPFDPGKLETGEESGLSIVLMKAFTDEVRFLSLGRHGKRIEMIKNLEYKGIETYLNEEEKQRTTGAPVAIQSDQIKMRLMRPEDAVNLSRCMYRCYGYTYLIEHLYYPDKYRELLDGGLQISAIAQAPDGEIAGHATLSKDHASHKTGEMGQVIMDPRYRNLGIMGRLTHFLVEHLKNIGILGCYWEGVAVHPYSQKTAMSLGFTEIGINLGILPPSWEFKEIETRSNKKRGSELVFYGRINEEEFRDVYIPLHHQSLVRRIYNKAGLKRNILNPANYNVAQLPALSQIDISVYSDNSLAYMYINQYGADLEALVKLRLKEICQKQIECIYIDLPLSSPVVQKVCAALEALGFFFCGVWPETHLGDVLRLQYLNNADVDFEGIQLVSDFGKEMFDYVVKSMS
ncbi:MAG: GNAT family N-acetyltransferase [Chloroflexi bacterium]|nr:GNAT family N-acetyltransferase [Chloroflexota bacterium]